LPEMAELTTSRQSTPDRVSRVPGPHGPAERLHHLPQSAQNQARPTPGDALRMQQQGVAAAAALALPPALPPARRRNRRRKSAQDIVVNVYHTDYEVVRKCALDRGWQLCERHFVGSLVQPAAAGSAACTHAGPCSRHFNIYWHDHSDFGAEFRHILSYQRFNHAPGLVCLARKTSLAMLLSRFRRQFPNECVERALRCCCCCY